MEINDQSDNTINEITKNYPMDNLLNHRFFLIRIIEKRRRKLLLKTINPKPGEIIADIGCERGHTLSDIYKKCPNVKKLYGIDLSEYALAIAKETSEWEGWNNSAKFIICDACKIKLPDNSVDVAISSNILEHLPNPTEGFNELCRITKPNGRIILNLPNEKRIVSIKKLFIKYKMGTFLGNLKINTPGHLHMPDKQFILDLCNKKGNIKKIFGNKNIFIGGLYIYAIIEPIKEEHR